MELEKVKHGLVLGVMIAFVTISCEFVRGDRDLRWVSCADALDSLLIQKESDRGAWKVNDSLVLSSGVEPIDKDLCDSIGVRSVTLWTPSGKERPCDLSDLYPPFKVFKNAESDTLYVIKDSKVLLFQIPEHMCE